LRDYTSNSDIIQELTESLEAGHIESVAEVTGDDFTDLRKLEKTLSRLLSVKEGYKDSLGMKRLVTQLADADVLTGPGCQEDIKTLKIYIW